MSSKNIVIIGNGISGVTLARNLRKKSDCRITIVSSETDYFYSRTALMYVFMGHMKFEHTQPYENDFWSKNNIELINKHVDKVEVESKKLLFSSGDSLDYDQLVLAVGSKPNRFGWSGENLDAVQGLYHKQDLEQMEKYASTTKRAVVVGGGLIGIEMVEMFLSRNIPVTMLVREQSFWQSVLPSQDAALITRHIQKHHVDLRLGVELDKILPDANGRARAITTSEGEEIACEFVGLTVGVSPNTTFLKDTELELEKGVLINECFETSIKDIYAIGDCAQFREPIKGRGPLEQVWYTGKIMGETLASTLTGTRKAYTPGHWYNSAKFFDIEYQTYGRVNNALTADQEEFYWEHSRGEKAVHFVFEKESRKFIGVNAFGIRLRHELFDRWLTDQKSIEYVLEHLKDANFDPEFYSKYEKQIVGNFNREFNSSIQVKRRSWKRIFNK
ncbi:FAD-dependent oxidoreductase [Cyclobacteriaceae bacterium]|nr:FAD-dependent oxidoreductase [Cyclobacteriaceae bacterium]